MLERLKSLEMRPVAAEAPAPAQAKSPDEDARLQHMLEDVDSRQSQLKSEFASKYDAMDHRFEALQEMLKKQLDQVSVAGAQEAPAEPATPGPAVSELEEQLQQMSYEMAAQAAHIAKLDQAAAAAAKSGVGLASLIDGKLDKGSLNPLQLQVNDFADRFAQFTAEQEDQLHDLVSKVCRAADGRCATLLFRAV